MEGGNSIEFASEHSTTFNTLGVGNVTPDNSLWKPLNVPAPKKTPIGNAITASNYKPGRSLNSKKINNIESI